MPIHFRRTVLHALPVLLLVLVWTVPARPAGARSGSDPMAIISAVNVLRATQGLPPYVVDQGLMSYALEHSRYQASLHTATHQHSDGSTVWQNGMDENIAEGMLGYLTPDYAVFTIWSDAIHMKTMIGYATGSVGAGVSDDGAKEFYTLDVRPGGAVIPHKGVPDPNATPTHIIPLVPLLTVTPRGDRWIIHTVGYGQSLWSVAIAYGVKMNQLRDWNSMEKDSTAVYAGQKLYIIAPANIWPTLTASPVGGPAVVEGAQTLTLGYSITEDPQAAAQKATYQATAGQDPNGMAQGTAPPTAAATATVSPAPSQGAPSSISGQTGAGTPANPDPPDSAAQEGDTLPLLAGVLILFGGGFLVMIAFWMMRKR